MTVTIKATILSAALSVFMLHSTANALSEQEIALKKDPRFRDCMKFALADAQTKPMLTPVRKVEISKEKCLSLYANPDALDAYLSGKRQLEKKMLEQKMVEQKVREVNVVPLKNKVESVWDRVPKELNDKKDKYERDKWIELELLKLLTPDEKKWIKMESSKKFHVDPAERYILEHVPTSFLERLG